MGFGNHVPQGIKLTEGILEPADTAVIKNGPGIELVILVLLDSDNKHPYTVLLCHVDEFHNRFMARKIYGSPHNQLGLKRGAGHPAFLGQAGERRYHQ